LKFKDLVPIQINAKLIQIRALKKLSKTLKKYTLELFLDVTREFWAKFGIFTKTSRYLKLIPKGLNNFYFSKF
jgi:hypothetical protein